MDAQLIKCFVTANDALYLDKQYFYDLKEDLLKVYGCYDGFEIEHRKIWDASTQRFNKIAINYKRYLLRNQLFHVPSTTMPAAPLRGKYKKREKLNNYFSPADSYKALIILLRKYRPSLLNDLINCNYQISRYWSMHRDEISLMINKELKSTGELSNVQFV